MTSIRRRDFFGIAAATPFIAAAIGRDREVDLRLLQTSDVHATLGMVDSLFSQPRDNGLNRLSGVIQRARVEAPNTLLFDCGDTLQGDPLGAYCARFGWDTDRPHPMYHAFDAMRYDAVALGNHDFDYGLPLLRSARKNMTTPALCANIVVSEGASFAAPTILLRRSLKTRTGARIEIKFGIIGVCTSEVLRWNAHHLRSRVTAISTVEAVGKWAPKLREAGADVVIVLAHSGIGGVGAKPLPAAVDSGAARTLARIPGVDVLLVGHFHQRFPDTSWADDQDVDLNASKLCGIPTMSPGSHAEAVGVLDLKLVSEEGRWRIAASKAELRGVGSAPLGTTPVVSRLASAYTNRVTRWMDAVNGEIPAPLDTYLSMIGTDPAMSLVHAAMRRAGKRILQTQYPAIANLPLVTAAPIFQDGRLGSPYVNIQAGNFQLRHAYQLHPFENLPQFIVLDGAALIEWIERCASIYQQVTTEMLSAPLFLDAANFGTVDTFGGISFTIDVSRPARYDQDSKKVSNDRRVLNSAIGGQPLMPTDRVVAMVGHHRAFGGGNFPGLDGTNIIGGMSGVTNTIPELIARHVLESGTDGEDRKSVV